MITLAVVNYKGGVGKTTTALYLSSLFMGAGYRTLAVDMEPQGNLSSSMGVNIAADYLSVAECLLGKCAPQDVLIPVHKGLYLLASGSALPEASTVLELTSPRKWEVLRYQLKQLADQFDICIIDTSPGRGDLLTMNALAAADWAIVPSQCENYSTVGLAHLSKSIVDLKKLLINENLRIAAVLPTFWRKTKEARIHIDMLENEFGQFVSPSRIRRSESLVQSSRSSGGFISNRKEAGYQDYEHFFRDLCNRIGVQPVGHQNADASERS